MEYNICLSRGGEMVYAHALRACEIISRVGSNPTLGTRGVAQLASAPRLGRGGPRFESEHPDLIK